MMTQLHIRIILKIANKCFKAINLRIIQSKKKYPLYLFIQSRGLLISTNLLKAILSLSSLTHEIRPSLSNFPPFQPKGGSFYLITDGQCIDNKDDWRADGYTWRNYGKNKVTNGDKIIEKSYFRIKNGKEESDKFQRVMLRYHGNDYNHVTLTVLSYQILTRLYVCRLAFLVNSAMGYLTR